MIAHGLGWPVAFYAGVGFVGGVVGATGELLQAPTAAVGVTVVLLAIAFTTYRFAAFGRRSSPVASTDSTPPQARARSAGSSGS